MARLNANIFRLRAAFSNFLFWIMANNFLNIEKTTSGRAYFGHFAINEVFNTTTPFFTKFLTLLLFLFISNRLFARHLCCIFFLSTHLSLVSQNGIQLRAEVDKLLRYEAEIDFQKTPGLIIGILDGDSTFILPYGSLYQDTIVPPDEHSVFELGDLTQVFTSACLLELALEGHIDLDKSINHYLPEALQNNTADEITLLNLLTHTAGLPRLPSGIGLHESADGQLFADYPLPYLAGFFKKFDFNLVKKGKYSYAPLGFALLDLLFYQNDLGRKKLAEYIEAKLYDLFGMDESYFDQPDSLRSPPVPGYNKAGLPTAPMRFASFRHALGLKSTMHDVLQFLKANLDNPSKLSELQRPLFPTHRKGTWSALGWHVLRHRKRPDIITHTGTTSGHRAAIAFVKETRTGVAILSNSPYGLNGLEFEILRMLNNDWKRKAP